MFGADNNFELIKTIAVPHKAKNLCDERFSSAEDSAICQRSIVAALAIAKFEYQMQKQRQQNSKKAQLPLEAPSLTTAARFKVENQTSYAHPSPQCRLDTLIAGALCPKQGERQSACTRSEGYSVEARPRCWFHPEDRRIPLMQIDHDVLRELRDL